MCICWSPDGKYVLTGGQDDLVSVWSLGERRIVARCPGHQSWVTAVAFDPWRCDDRNYRFGSVGEDRRLLLWDFNVGMLHRPKAVCHLDLLDVTPLFIMLTFPKVLGAAKEQHVISFAHGSKSRGKSSYVCKTSLRL